MPSTGAMGTNASRSTEDRKDEPMRGESESVADRKAVVGWPREDRVLFGEP